MGRGPEELLCAGSPTQGQAEAFLKLCSGQDFFREASDCSRQSPGALNEMHIARPTPNLMNQGL
jgi:hypothetical protein